MPKWRLFWDHNVKHNLQKKPFYKVNFTRENNSSCSKQHLEHLEKKMYFIFRVILSHFVAIVFLWMPNGLIWNQLFVLASFHFCSLWIQTSFKFPSDRVTQRLKRKSGIVAGKSNCEEKEVLTILPSASGMETGFGWKERVGGREANALELHHIWHL